MARKKSKSELIDSGNAYIAKIPDSYMFNSGNSTKRHFYVVYKDSKSNKVRAVETSHLYDYDQHGRDYMQKPYFGCEMKFPQQKLPSAVCNYYRDKNINGGDIDIENPDIQFLSSRPLSGKQFNAVKAVAPVSNNTRFFHKKKAPRGTKNNSFRKPNKKNSP